jgi:hypothetical protein
MSIMAYPNIEPRENQHENAHAHGNPANLVTLTALRSALVELFVPLDSSSVSPSHTDPMMMSWSEFQSCFTKHFPAIDLHVIRASFYHHPPHDDHGQINMHEFLSFVCGGQHPMNDSDNNEPLGVLGYQLRNAMLDRIKATRKDALNVQDAVRLVFSPCFDDHGNTDTDVVPDAMFCHVLTCLELGFSPAILARLILRLDKVQTIFYLIWMNDGPRGQAFLLCLGFCIVDKA